MSEMKQMLTLKQMQQESNKIANDKGWWEGRDPVADIPQLLCLVHSEVSEALEDFRNGDLELTIAESGKPEGLPSELADILIRVGDMAEALGIDLNDAVLTKMKYNATRSHRHGGKTC